MYYETELYKKYLNAKINQCKREFTGFKKGDIIFHKSHLKQKDYSDSLSPHMEENIIEGLGAEIYVLEVLPNKRLEGFVFNPWLSGFKPEEVVEVNSNDYVMMNYSWEFRAKQNDDNFITTTKTKVVRPFYRPNFVDLGDEIEVNSYIYDVKINQDVFIAIMNDSPKDFTQVKIW